MEKTKMSGDWVDIHHEFIQQLSKTDREHLPYCRKFTGHNCDCWQERIFKIKKAVEPLRED